MRPRLFELLWEVHTDAVTLVHREFKALGSRASAGRYGLKRERSLNDGLPRDEKADDGYCFQYRGAIEVKEIDGFQVVLSAARA